MEKLTQEDCKRELLKLWEPRMAVPFAQRTPRDGEIANLLCVFVDDCQLEELELEGIRRRVAALLET